jgi:hypothetical protein
LRRFSILELLFGFFQARRSVIPAFFSPSLPPNLLEFLFSVLILSEYARLVRDGHRA